MSDSCTGGFHRCWPMPSPRLLPRKPLYTRFVCAEFAHVDAARLSTVNEIMQIGPANASDVYCQVAKVSTIMEYKHSSQRAYVVMQTLLPAGGSQATIETLHAVMLLSWAAHKRGRDTMFSVYARVRQFEAIRP